ncbi:MAG TPA: FCD domain-containing protein [Amycolatopsis sp.]|nr:FCD domain-containing protein [Amycolatopsis sp.]
MAIRAERIVYALARDIVSDVVDAKVRPGEVLEAEADMMRRYDVSRGSLRESLRILEALGFIHLKPGPRGGPVVLKPDVSQFSAIATLYYQRISATYFELLEARRVIESATATLAAARCTPEDAERMREHLAAASVADPSDDGAFKAVGHGFHILVSDIAQNRVLGLMTRSCTDVVETQTSRHLYPAERRRASVLEVHERVGRAIIEGDVRTAESAMAEHMQDYVSEAAARYGSVMDQVVHW